MSALRTLLSGLSDNSYKLLTLSGEVTAMANGLPRTLDNFDPGGHLAPVTWASDAAVNQNVMAGISTVNTPSMWAFGGCGISYDGYCLYFGGGHAASGDGTFYGLDPELAAANINGGGSGISWIVKVPSGRYLDAFTNVQPSWSSQPTITPTPTGPNQSYYVTTNKNGRNMPAVGHSYHGIKAMPGTRTFLFSSFGVYDANGQPALGEPWNYDATNDVLIGPLSVTDNTTGFGPDVVYGYGQACNAEGGPTPVCISPSDSTVYSIAGNPSPAFGNFVVKYTDPLTSSIAQTVAPNPTTPVFDQKSYSFARNDGVIIPDPADPLDEIMFLHGINDATSFDDAKFLIATGLKGHATPAFVVGTYASGSVVTNGSTLIAPCYDSKRGVIVFTDGGNLFQVTPNASPSLWAIAQITGSTGDTPPSPATLNPSDPSAVIAALNYVPGEDCFIHAQLAEVRVWRPIGWSPPSTGPAPYQGLLLAMWGWVGTQVTARAGAPVESLATANTTVTGDSGTPLEITGTIAADIAARSESLAVAAKDSGTPVEALAGTRSDAIAPAEALGTIRADAGAPLEFLATLRVDAVAPSEWATTVRIDGAAPIETLGGVRSDGAAPDEAFGAARRDAGAPSESSGTLRADGAAPIEGLAGVRSDAAAPEEFLGTAARDAGAPLEWSGAVSVTMDGIAPLEWVATARADASAQAEALSSVRRDSAAYAEFLAGCVRDALAPTAFLAGISADVVGKIEFQTSLAGDAGGRLEWQGTIARDAGAPLEWVARLVADGAARIEWTGNIAAFTGDSALRLEWSATVRRDGFPAFEIQGAIPRFLFIVADAIASASIAGETIALPTIVNESLTAAAAASETLE